MTGPIFFKDSLFKNVHPRAHLLNTHAPKHPAEFQVLLNICTEGETFPHQSHSSLHFSRGNPVGSWERAMVALLSGGPCCCLAFTMKRIVCIIVLAGAFLAVYGNAILFQVLCFG